MIKIYIIGFIENDNNYLSLILSKINIQSLLDNNEINKDNFNKIFTNFIFLGQLFISNELELNELNELTQGQNIRQEFLNLKEKIEEYLRNSDNKQHNMFYYLNNFADKYNQFLKSNGGNNNDFYSIFEKSKIKCEDYTFKNIETNILTSILSKEKFNDKSLKYLLTATKYPNIEELNNSINNSKENPKILKAFLNINTKNDDNITLSYIEYINNFINSFAEENKNLISRQESKKTKIKDYLDKNIYNKEGEGKSSFDIFCEAYDNISPSGNINKDSKVIDILNDNKEGDNASKIYKLYSEMIKIQNKFLKAIKNEINEEIKVIKIQQATKGDIFEFNVKSNVIFSFEELYSFYSIKDIFNESNNKIDYSKYSNIKFKLSEIEKELKNIILTGKKIFSEEQITYHFYLDPYQRDIKYQIFEDFNKLYEKDNKGNLTDEQKESILRGIKKNDKLEKIFMPNLEIIINYLLDSKHFFGNESISDIKFDNNLFINQDFLHFFNNFKFITIDKLVYLYEYIEEQFWEKISDRYIDSELNQTNYNFDKIDLVKYIKNEEKKIKNEDLISLLIKFICRDLPYAKEYKDNDLFEVMNNKYTNLSKEMHEELIKLKGDWTIQVKYIIELTKRMNKTMKKLSTQSRVTKEDIKNDMNEEFGDEQSDGEDGRFG